MGRMSGADKANATSVDDATHEMKYPDKFRLLNVIQK